MNWRGASVNLSESGGVAQIELPCPPLFETSGGPVIELVFYSSLCERWCHLVSAPVERTLPPGHVQVSLGDLAWIKHAERVFGPGAVRACALELEAFPHAEDAS